MDFSRDESQLITRAQTGDAQALADLHDRHWQAIFNYIFFRVSDAAAAEDLTADVFVRMVTAIERYQNHRETILPWLYTIARNLVTDYYRKNNSNPTFVPLAEDVAASRGNPEVVVNRHLGIECLKLALKHLTEIQHQVVVGKFIEGRSNREIADLTGRTEGAVKSIQHRALAALRRAIEKEKCLEP